jgi:hypothetical protein
MNQLFQRLITLSQNQTRDIRVGRTGSIPVCHPAQSRCLTSEPLFSLSRRGMPL